MTKRTRLVMLVTLVLASGLIGAGVAMLWAPPQVTTVEEVTAPEAIVDVSSATADPVIMPDVVGLDEAIATRVFADAGIGPDVTVSTTKSAGPGGRILSQSPDPGVADPASVEIEVTQPVKVPDITGKPLEVAREELSVLGIEVLATRVVDPAAASGEVLSSTPGPGEEAPLTVEVVVADEGEVVPLTSIDGEYEGSWDREEDYIYGTTTFSTVVIGQPSDEEEVYLEYSLEQRAEVLTTTLGVNDAPAGQTMEVVVTTDGEPVDTFTATAGENTPVEIGLDGVRLLRFTLGASDLEERPSLVIGDPGLRGDTELLRELQ